ncbi:MAG: hypothetical protein MI799_16380, partial [Desulfobacterales bacterium]|nr:hypothetical protein [Desulfobacterales bacterium]
QVKKAAAKLGHATEQGKIPETLVNELKKALQTFINAVKPLKETEPANKTENVDVDAAYQYMDKIKTLIASSDVVAADHILGLKNALGGSVDPIIIARLKNSLEDFDYQDADEILTSIRSWIDHQSSKEKGV